MQKKINKLTTLEKIKKTQTQTISSAIKTKTPAKKETTATKSEKKEVKKQ